MAKNQFDRPRRQRHLIPKVLIVCEGEATEVLYFKGIKRAKKRNTINIKVLDADGKTNPMSIINRAIDERQKIKDDDGWEPVDTAWAIFDGDEHMANLNNWRSALALAESKRINLAITNPCFEFWYLIHFQDAFSQMNANTAYKRLQKAIPGYDKAKIVYPDPLADRTPAAIDRAEKIAQQIQRDGLDRYSNPSCSRLPELVKMLLEMP
jgi:sulfur relay (sulfurtransferase) DsrC/TusE family protein